MKRLFILLTATLLLNSFSFGQTKPRFWDDVQIIKGYDKMYKPPVHPVLFIGSSSIRKWDNVQQVFAEYNALNRGIGGAVTDDITYYLNDLVFPYQPRQIILYVGENDLPGENITADSVLNKTVRLYKGIRARLPEVPIVYISIKPSPVREKYIQKAVDANRLIKAFLVRQANTSFIDVFSLMLTKDGKTRSELFVEDKLHMNKMGYDIWEKALRPYLAKK